MMEMPMRHVHILSGAERSRLISSAWLLTSLAAFAFLPGAALAQRPCPATPSYVTEDTVRFALEPPAATRVPDDVCTKRGVDPQKELPYFDDYSWRTFIALVWPALIDDRGFPERGVPDPEQQLEPIPEAIAVPRGPASVFETYKADWETFQPLGAKPTPWNDYSAEWNDAQWSCHQGQLRPQQQDFFLVPSAHAHGRDLPDVPEHFSYFDNVLQFGRPASTLIAQNGTFVRYLSAYNQIEFNQILAKEWYLADRLPDTAKGPFDKIREKEERVEFLEGALSVKSTWVDMARINRKGEVGPYTVAHPERYHRRVAWLYDPYKRNDPHGQCERHVVGLVGLHIVQKTRQRPQWVWATFEHVDNAPDRVAPYPPAPSPGIGLPCPTPANMSRYYAFNDGKQTPMQGLPGEYQANSVVSASCPPMPVNIERLHPINGDNHDTVDRSTQRTNVIWRSELKRRDSVWQYYQLVMTQWPVNTGGENDPVNCDIGGGQYVLCGDPATTIPGSGFDHSAFSNTTLETWIQTNIDHGCMNCHSKTRKDHIDFVWSLLMNAYRDPKKPRPFFPSPALFELQKLLDDVRPR